MNYYFCTKCGKFIDFTEVNSIYSGKDLSVYWCNDCVSKHLNTSNIKE